jgi:hypothetical protein
MSKPHSTRKCCARCGRPVQEDEDFLRAHLWGAVVYLHWQCFLVEIQDAKSSTKRST